MSAGFPTSTEILAAIGIVEDLFGACPNLKQAREHVEKITEMARSSAVDADNIMRIIASILRLIPAEINEDSIERDGEWAVVFEDGEGWKLYSADTGRYAEGLSEYMCFSILEELPSILRNIRDAMSKYQDRRNALWAEVRKVVEA